MGLQAPLPDELLERARHRAGMVAQGLGEFPLGDPEDALIGGVRPDVIEDLGVDVGLDRH